MKVGDIRQELTTVHLSNEGTKPILVTRLAQYKHTKSIFSKREEFLMVENKIKKEWIEKNAVSSTSSTSSTSSSSSSSRKRKRSEMRNMGRRTGEDEEDEEDEDIEMFRGPEDLRIVWQTGVTFVTRPNLSSLFQFKVSKEKATGNLVIVGSSHPGITVSDFYLFFETRGFILLL